LRLGACGRVAAGQQRHGQAGRAVRLAGANPATLAAQRRLVESLGGTYHQITGDDVPEALLDFARGENATQLVLGASRRSWLATVLTGPGIGARTIQAPVTSTCTSSPTRRWAAVGGCPPRAAG